VYEAAYAGAERLRKETGVAYREFEVTAEVQREQRDPCAIIALA
jgi:basic membrane protein A